MTVFTREQHLHTAMVMEREAEIRSGSFKETLLVWAKNARRRADSLLPIQGDLFTDQPVKAAAREKRAA